MPKPVDKEKEASERLKQVVAKASPGEVVRLRLAAKRSPHAPQEEIITEVYGPLTITATSSLVKIEKGD